MAYETSYDTGLKPFNHDKTRGKWSSPIDFFCACLGHTFKVDAIIMLPSIIFKELGIYGMIPYFIVLFTCVVPIVFMQSFLGQFSSTGFISVFRIAPLFKGIGYVSLAINLTTLTYFSVYSAIPLFYFFHSLRPTLPWSCEGSKEWINYEENVTSPCFENQTIHNGITMQVPSLEFFRDHFNPMDFHKRDHPAANFSWSIMMCTLLVWVMVGAVLLKRIEMVSRFIRYSCLLVIGILCLCVIRVAFLPGALVGLRTFLEPTHTILLDSWASIPVVALCALGPGWGSILTMASYNNFKTDIFKFSWLLCLAQFGIMFGLALLSIFISSFLQRADPEKIYFMFLHTQWMEFLITPTALTFLEVPHFWSIIFFGMMILGSLNLLVVQLFSVLTSLFDEYEKLRIKQREVTLGLLAVLALASTFFCSNIGMTFSEELSKFSIMTQMVLNLLLLLVVLWVYGRERFQRDVNFMTSRTYPTWMVNIVRFVAPLFLLISLLIGFFYSVSLGHFTWLTLPLVILIVFLPWLLIPGYCIFKITQTSGMLGMRFRRCVRPTDWYPVDPIDRQKYEETFSNSEISHQLTTTTVE